MRVNLNLLPEQKKQNIEKKKRLKIIIYQGFLLFSVIVLLAIILVNINILLQIELKSVEDITALQQNQNDMLELKKYESKFKEINSKVSSLSQIKKSNFHWSKLFDLMSKLTPDNITLSGLSTKDYQISLVGQAATREDLIKFKDNLTDENCLSDVNVPLSNLVVKNDVDFQLDFKIKKECLNNNE
jgi:Tfp pilus assembly protein PilN